MRYGCCLNMIAGSSDKGTGIGFIETLAKAGYDYVELPLAEMTALTDAEFLELEGKVKASGIRCEVCNNFFPKTVRLTGDGVDHDGIMAYVERALKRAQALGVEYVVFGSGPAKNVPDGYPLEKGYAQVAELLRMVDRRLDEYGITVVIEPLRREECNLINSFAEGCRLAEDVGGTHIKVLVDYYHMWTEKEPEEHIARDGKEYLRHVHFADPNGRVYPKIEEGTSGYRPFFHALQTIGYDGRISCEAYTDDFGKDAGKALEFFHEMAARK